jgi:two-component system, OmpR family, response regulator
MASKDLLRVLLIEDDPDTQIIVKTVLEDMNNLDVVTCSSGQEGLKRVHDFGPDLVLLDIRLPDIDGVDYLRTLRAQPETKTVPVIFMTAYPPKPDEYKNLGVLHVISKPFDPLVLSHLIESIWKQRFG